MNALGYLKSSWHNYLLWRGPSYGFIAQKDFVKQNTTLKATLNIVAKQSINVDLVIQKDLQ